MRRRISQQLSRLRDIGLRVPHVALAKFGVLSDNALHMTESLREQLPAELETTSFSVVRSSTATL